MMTLKTSKHSKNQIAPVLLGLFALLLWGGCAAVAPESPPPAPAAAGQTGIVPFEDQKIVAVAGFENRSAFGADKLWDTCSQMLSTRLIEQGYFRVVEWERMKQLFDWDALSTSTLVKTPESRTQARRILLCEYFVTGAVTHFDVSRHARTSAFSKQKTYDTSVRVDLLMQNAATGEYLCAASAEALETQVFKAGVAGGQTGTWSPRAADKALDSAIQKALTVLIQRYQQLPESVK